MIIYCIGLCAFLFTITLKKELLALQSHHAFFLSATRTSVGLSKAMYKLTCRSSGMKRHMQERETR